MNISDLNEEEPVNGIPTGQKRKGKAVDYKVYQKTNWKIRVKPIKMIMTLSRRRKLQESNCPIRKILLKQ